MRLEECNWFDIENYLKNDDRLMLVLGACEQHGYLSLLTDAKIPLALADAASQASGVVVAPPLNFGCSPYFMAYPGTLSLRVSTLLDLVEDLVLSAYRHGFRRVLVLNGHSGNSAACNRLFELADRCTNLHLSWYEWWDSQAVQEVARCHELKSYHASWLEAFPFTRVCDLPTGSKPPVYISGILGAQESRQIYGDGVLGGSYQVDAEIMEEIFAAALADVVQMLKFE